MGGSAARNYQALFLQVANDLEGFGLAGAARS